MSHIIKIKGLTKTFKVHHRTKEGLWPALKSLFKRTYKTVCAVDSIDLEIKKGEIRALIGPNGAGKSTTIKMLSGILYPTEGDIEVMGYVPWKEREKYVKNIGVLFGQKGQLNWVLPAIDTFALHKQIYKIDPVRFKKNLDYFVDILKLENIITKPVRNLSLGERMKCEFVCALLHEPSLVFLDEPTIGLDVVSKEAIRNFIKKVNKELGVTFILTTHDLNEVENICNDVTIINHGKVIYSDKLASLAGRFARRKVIELQFEHPIEKSLQEEYGFQMIDPVSARLEVDTGEIKLAEEASRLFSLLPVKDINISGIDIESVIRDIYLQKV